MSLPLMAVLELVEETGLDGYRKSDLDRITGQLNILSGKYGLTPCLGLKPKAWFYGLNKGEVLVSERRKDGYFVRVLPWFGHQEFYRGYYVPYDKEEAGVEIYMPFLKPKRSLVDRSGAKITVNVVGRPDPVWVRRVIDRFIERMVEVEAALQKETKHYGKGQRVKR